MWLPPEARCLQAVAAVPSSFPRFFFTLSTGHQSRDEPGRRVCLSSGPVNLSTLCNDNDPVLRPVAARQLRSSTTGKVQRDGRVAGASWT
jgi:hypothetical protein